MAGAETIERDGVVAVVRLEDLTDAAAIARALVAGGVRAVEFTFTNRRAAEAIGAAKDAVGDDGYIGAGSVLDAETARVAILAGAEYVVTPTFKPATVELCNRYGVPTACGAFTPTEILTAWEAGATYIKVHPASLGGPKYFKDVLGPMPQVKLIPSGGVTFDNVAEFVRCGAVAVALGSNLVDAKTVRSGAFETLTERAAALRQLVTEAREGVG